MGHLGLSAVKATYLVWGAGVCFGPLAVMGALVQTMQAACKASTVTLCALLPLAHASLMRAL